MKTLDFSDLPLDQFFIGGSWCSPVSDKSLSVVSPNDETVIARVAEAVEADADKALFAARSAFDNGPWPYLSYGERAQWLAKLSAALKDKAERFAICWSAQVGAPYHSLAANAAPMFAQTLDEYVALAETFAFEAQKPTQAAPAGFLVHQPVGVVLAIAPWNVPLNTLLHKVGPALLAGCSVIMKPSPQTPLEAYIIAQCAAEIGLPDGVLNLINAERDVSDYLVNQPGIDKVAFTGSVAAGKRIASVCSARMARFTLELGGKSAAIVLDDFDLEDAAQSLVGQICTLSGQNCAALSRVLIRRERHDALVEKMKAAAEAIVIGHSFDETTQLGPIAMKRQRERIEALVSTGLKEGASLVAGGQRPASLSCGYFFEPTVFGSVSNDMTIAREEIFGPVLCVLPFDDVDQAVAIANASDYGLAGAVYTHDLDQAYAVARKIRTGTVGHNGPLADFSIGFGGFKQSGIGREGGAQGLSAYLEPKTLLLQGVPSALGA